MLNEIKACSKHALLSFKRPEDYSAQQKLALAGFGGLDDNHSRVRDGEFFAGGEDVIRRVAGLGHPHGAGSDFDAMPLEFADVSCHLRFRPARSHRYGSPPVFWSCLAIRLIE